MDSAPNPSAANITTLLRAWKAGDQSAAGELFPVVYGELKKIAERYMRRERKEHTLQPTALVHEAFVRLIELRNLEWQDRTHFFALSAQMMRRILVNYALARGAGKRRGHAQQVTFDEAMVVARERDRELVELDEALTALAKLDSRKAQIVELRFFGGLSVDETAEVLKVSSQTVLRDWKLAKTWLAREISRAAGG